VSKKVIVIGAGFAGLSAACYLAKYGYSVTVLEKNSWLGGRASVLEKDGFTFDKGPSWYWMPEVFEHFFNNFGHQTQDFYELKRLDPSYRVFLENNRTLDIPANFEALKDVFESLESGSAKKLEQFLAQAKYKYDLALKDFINRPNIKIAEFLDPKLLLPALKLGLFQSFRNHAKKFFNHPDLLKIIEFPILFLGGTAEQIPALYSLMNYADMVGGTWYPMGGFSKIPEAMVKIATELGVTFYINEEVIKINVQDQKAAEVQTMRQTFTADIVVANGDYHHIEQRLLELEYRNYSEEYWQKRTLAPSALLFFLGFKTKVKNLLHHNLFFEADFNLHAEQIYQQPQWPTDPQLYISVTSKTDPTVAPSGHENLFALIPIAPGLDDGVQIREHYFSQILRTIERISGQSLACELVVNESYSLQNFEREYHAYRGNAYGLANTLFQTAIFKPKMKNIKVPNLYYCGQLTVPGPGVPPCIISGHIVADLIHQEHP
jgi:phytoene desaturase